MSCRPFSARLGALAAAGAVSVGLATAGVASAATPFATGAVASTPHSSPASQCPGVSKVSKGAKLKINYHKAVKKDGAVECEYANTSSRKAIVIQPTRYSSESTSYFYARMAKTAKNYGTVLHKLTLGGRPAGYCYEGKHSKVIFGAIDDPRHVLTAESNLSVKQETSLLKALA